MTDKPKLIKRLDGPGRTGLIERYATLGQPWYFVRVEETDHPTNRAFSGWYSEAEAMQALDRAHEEVSYRRAMRLR